MSHTSVHCDIGAGANRSPLPYIETFARLMLWSEMVPRRFVYPQTGALMRHYEDGDFLDSQIAKLPDASASAADLAVATFFAMPRWVLVLLGLRDKLVGPLGLKTGSSEGFTPPSREDLASGRYTGVFGVESVSDEEVVLGSDDRHLDFRVSVLKTRNPAGMVALSTWVHPHNIWGRLYLWLVYPFHKLIVWRMLANLKDVPGKPTGSGGGPT